MKKLLVILLIVMLGVGCAAFAQAAVEPMRCYGTPTESAVLGVFINDAAQPIVQLWIKASDNRLAVSLNLPEGSSIAPGERFGIWIEPDMDGKPVCDLMLGFADGRQMPLHGIDVSVFKEAIIQCDVNVAYLSYVSLLTGEPVSTWLSELRLLALEESVDYPIMDSTERMQTEERDFAS